MHKVKISFILIFFCGLVQGQIINPAYKFVIDVALDKTVPLISVEEIDNIYYSSEILFLDTRAKEEYDRSKIISAHWVGYKNFKKENLPKMNLNDTIVLYCSIGYRSEKIGEKLIEMGYKHVYNLYGGIFEWVNRDMLVYNRRGEKTDSVHAYSPEWGIWLNKGIKVYE